MSGRARPNPQFDRAQLAMLGEALGRDELRAMLSGLPAEIAAIMGRIEAALAEDDRDAASRASLVLRSVASNFGAARLASACREFSRGIVRETSMPARLAELSDTIDKTLVALDLELGDALRRDEFALLYQPWFEVGSGRIAGCEALARWRHPTRGLLAAMQFIPMAEESGLIAQLSGWVLRRACADAVTWPCEVKLSINLSPGQYASDYLCGAVFDALDFTGLAAERLELEILDPLTAGDLRKLKRNLEELAGRGIGIALDRFGGRQSSLNDIRELPCTRIKIDKALVASVTQSARDARIVATLVALAQSSGLAVTAEGVETAAQADLLRGLGCTEMQGFLFSRPRTDLEVLADMRVGFATAPADAALTGN
jgi:EAL domain-containing protein (putative c-di-GMP-specific phosphodiesterase class I)